MPLRHVDVDRVRCTPDDASITNEAADVLVKFGVQIDGIAGRSTQHRGFFSKSQLLRERVNQPLHRVVLSWIRADDQAVASKLYNLACRHLDFKTSGFHAVTRHL